MLWTDADGLLIVSHSSLVIPFFLCFFGKTDFFLDHLVRILFQHLFQHPFQLVCPRFIFQHFVDVYSPLHQFWIFDNPDCFLKRFCCIFVIMLFHRIIQLHQELLMQLLQPLPGFCIFYIDFENPSKSLDCFI